MAVGPDYTFLLAEQISRDLSYYRNALALVGLCFLGKSVVSLSVTVMKGIKTHVLSRTAQNDLKKYGKWAVVTGCTDGIGRAYCFEFAKHGLNVALIGRNRRKLEALATELEDKYKILATYCDVDFSHGPDIYEQIAGYLDTIETGILVNNVGVISPRPSYVSEMLEPSLWEHININIAAVTIITRLVLPGMLKRGHGAIINIASIASVAPTPLFAVYSATKAYVAYFSQALHEELKYSGVVVQTLIPSYVRTRMVSYNKNLMKSALVPSPEEYVSNAILTLGRNDFTTGYWIHGVQAWLISMCPLWLYVKATFLLNKYFRKQYEINRLR